MLQNRQHVKEWFKCWCFAFKFPFIFLHTFNEKSVWDLCNPKCLKSNPGYFICNTIQNTWFFENNCFIKHIIQLTNEKYWDFVKITYALHSWYEEGDFWHLQAAVYYIRFSETKQSMVVTVQAQERLKTISVDNRNNYAVCKVMLWCCWSWYMYGAYFYMK